MRGIMRKWWGYKVPACEIKSVAPTYLIVYISRESKSALIPSIICNGLKKFLETFKICANLFLNNCGSNLLPMVIWHWSIIRSLRLNTLWKVQNKMINSDKYSLFLIVLLDFLKSAACITFKSFFLKQNCHHLFFTKSLHTIKTQSFSL